MTDFRPPLLRLLLQILIAKSVARFSVHGTLTRFLRGEAQIRCNRSSTNYVVSVTDWTRAIDALESSDGMRGRRTTRGRASPGAAKAPGHCRCPASVVVNDKETLGRAQEDRARLVLEQDPKNVVRRGDQRRAQLPPQRHTSAAMHRPHQRFELILHGNSGKAN